MVYARLFCKPFSNKRMPHTTPSYSLFSTTPPPPTSSLSPATSLPLSPLARQPQWPSSPSHKSSPPLSSFSHRAPTLSVWLSAWYKSRSATHLGSRWLRPAWSCDGLRQSDLTSLSLSLDLLVELVVGFVVGCSCCGLRFAMGCGWLFWGNTTTTTPIRSGCGFCLIFCEF